VLTIDGEWFVDEVGRRVLLRGVNVGGSSKVPLTPNGATHNKTDFTDYDVSFVGRPFPLNQARRHFERITTLDQNSMTWSILTILKKS